MGSASNQLIIRRLVAAHQEHAEAYYRRADGSPTGHARNIDLALRVVVARHGGDSVDSFRVGKLIACRDVWVRQGLARTTINQRVAQVRGVWRWAVEREMATPTTLASLRSLSPLKPGRSAARETCGVRPVGPDVVAQTIPHMTPAIADVCRLLLATGMRWSEALRMRGDEIDRSDDVWLYRPTQHKTRHLGRERVIPFGPNARSIIARRLLRFGSGSLFRPVDSRDKPYHPDGARLAIYRACDRAGTPRWAPGQIRHTVATRLRSEFGLDVARAVLGHSTQRTTEIYAEMDLRAAAEAMRNVG